MGEAVLVLGETGSGKSYSIRNFSPDEVGIFAVEKSHLPFRNNFKIARHATYETIMSVFKNDPQLKTYIIDDSQYLMVNEMFDKAKDTGYGKFTDIALHFRNLIHFINHQLPDDVIVYFLHHTETDSNTGKIKAKTVGKMLDISLLWKVALLSCFFARQRVLNTTLSHRAMATQQPRVRMGCSISAFRMI